MRDFKIGYFGSYNFSHALHITAAFIKAAYKNSSPPQRATNSSGFEMTEFISFATAIKTLSPST